MRHVITCVCVCVNILDTCAILAIKPFDGLTSGDHREVLAADQAVLSCATLHGDLYQSYGSTRKTMFGHGNPCMLVDYKHQPATNQRNQAAVFTRKICIYGTSALKL